MNKTIILAAILLSACNNKPDTPEIRSNPVPVINNSGYKVNIDPATGEFLPSSPPQTVLKTIQLPTASSKIQANQSQQVEIVPSDIPGGGQMIRLERRFLSDEQNIQASDK